MSVAPGSALVDTGTIWRKVGADQQRTRIVEALREWSYSVDRLARWEESPGREQAKPECILLDFVADRIEAGWPESREEHHEKEG